jgi:hypothetical protein
MSIRIRKVMMLAGLAMIIAAAGSAYGETAVWKGWKNSLKPAGKEGPMLTLARDGKTEYKIVTAAKATTKNKKAADDMAYFLKEIYGWRQTAN